MDLGLTDKVVLVTAASTGLGLATAKQLAKEGAKVVICGRDQTRLDHAVAAIKSVAPTNRNIASFRADLAVANDPEQLVEQTLNLHGHLDALMTNIGGPRAANFMAVSDSDWETAFHGVLMSAVRVIRAAQPYLDQSDMANILTVTSVSAKEPISGLTLSNVFRPALLGLTKTLAEEFGDHKIRVNSILPGWTETERSLELLQKRAQQNQVSVADETAKIAATVPLNRLGSPEEFANVATFLMSPAASYINGVMLPVDGGQYPGLL